MTNNILYASSGILDQITKLAARRFNRNYADIGMITSRITQEKYRKHGRELVKEVISFHVYDKALRKIGIIKREDVIDSAKPLMEKREARLKKQEVKSEK